MMFPTQTPCLLLTSSLPSALKVSFDADEQSAAYLLTGEKPPPREALLRGGSAVGYTTLLEATCHALGLLALPLWPDAERTEVRHENIFVDLELCSLSLRR